MNKNFSKIAIFSLSLLLATSVSASSVKNPKLAGTWANAQDTKIGIEVPVAGTNFAVVGGLNPLKWGLKYEMVLANKGIGAGSGATKARMEFTIGDLCVWSRLSMNLARTAFVDAPLATGTWAGQQLAMVNSYLLFAGKEVREKIKELLALKKEQPVTLEAKRAQVSRMLALKAEIAELLAQ